MKKILLGSILHMTKGKKPKAQAAKQEAGFLPYVDIKAFEKRIVDNYASPEKCLLCQDGDVLIVCDGARSGLVGRAMTGVVGSTLALVSADGCSNDYLFYFLQSLYTLLNTKQKGTGTPHLNPDILKKAQLTVPPLPEQERIVAKIEELFSQLDAAVAELKSVKEKLAIYRQAVLKEAFDKLSTIKIRDICIHVTDGDHMPPPKAQLGIPFIMISNIHDNRINWTNTCFVNEQYFKAISEKRIPQRGDVLYTVTGSFGIPVKIDFDIKFCFQRHIALLRPDQNLVMQDFLYYALQSPAVFLQASKRATGTAQKTVGLTVLRDLDIPFINDKIQQQSIVLDVESKLSIYCNIEQTVDTALQQAAALRQSILKQAFEGNL